MNERKIGAKSEVRSGSLHWGAGCRVKEARVQSILSPQRDPLAQVVCRLGDESCAQSHASVLTRATDFRPAQGAESLLQLQRQYGNRYVRRMLGQVRGSGKVGSFAAKPVSNGLAEMALHRTRQPVVQRDDYEETTEPVSELEEGVKDVLAGLSPAVYIARMVAAKSCLEELFEPMKALTRSWISDTCNCILADYLYSREPDAFGHCWIACEGSRRCGVGPTLTLGALRELDREREDITGEAPHDSLSQDLANQALGGTLAFSEGTCYSLCDQAYWNELLDLSAPKHKVGCAAYDLAENLDDGDGDS